MDDIPVKRRKRLRIFELDAAREALREGRKYVFWGIDVTPARVDGVDVLFATDKLGDPIQRANRNGRFYEPEELEIIRGVFPAGGTFVDIGANIGNHSLFVAKFLAPGKVVPFEPNPLAYRLLVANVAFNHLGDVVDLSHVGVGISDQPAGGFAMTDRVRNLGAARMVEGEGDIEVVRGDDALAGVTPDFIKIDVEGMEMRALAGLEATIARARPVMGIEVDRENDTAFRAWLDAHDYEIFESSKRYEDNENFFVRPVGKAAGKAKGRGRGK